MTEESPEAGFRVLDADDPAQFAEWLDIWRGWPEREVFAHPAYVRLFADDSSQPKCAVWQSAISCGLYPFLLRNLPRECFREFPEEPVADLISPYGYGGAFAWNTPDPETASSLLWRRFGEWAHTNQVVSEFVRFSLFSDNYLPYPGQKTFRGPNVVRSLEPPEETIWMDFRHKVRKNVRRAQSHGLRIEVDATGARLAQFFALYNGTMFRRSADEFYYFPKEFFERMNYDLAGHYAYFHCFHGDTMISTELVLLSRFTVYSFLGGTDERYFEMRPNDLLKHEIILWAKGCGKKNYVLGGGYQPDDGIYRYKLSFAPGGEAPFYTGNRILNRDMYDLLVRSRAANVLQKTGREWAPREGFFPEYRA